MNYFLTGGTGFIGHNLIEHLLHRRGNIYVLVRSGSREKFKKLSQKWGVSAKRVIPITGDLSKPFLGIRPGQAP